MDYESVCNYLLEKYAKQQAETDKWYDYALKALDVMYKEIRRVSEHRYEVERWARDQAIK